MLNFTPNESTCINNFHYYLIYLKKQNGYPSRRRSLVDDARFESSVVKQTKQNILDEARVKSNGELLCVFDTPFWTPYHIRHVTKIFMYDFLLFFILYVMFRLIQMVMNLIHQVIL